MRLVIFFALILSDVPINLVEGKADDELGLVKQKANLETNIKSPPAVNARQKRQLQFLPLLLPVASFASLSSSLALPQNNPFSLSEPIFQRGPLIPLTHDYPRLSGSFTRSTTAATTTIRLPKINKITAAATTITRGTTTTSTTTTTTPTPTTTSTPSTTTWRIKIRKPKRPKTNDDDDDDETTTTTPSSNSTTTEKTN